MVDMMASAKVEIGLVPRLERLTGESARCCVPEYRELSRQVANTRGFSVALARARALSDKSRMTAVTLLRRRPELCACEIQAVLGVSHATVSHHMAVLTAAGIVSGERHGKWMYYRLTSTEGVAIP
jgi:ArsR family transcriptional regulator